MAKTKAPCTELTLKECRRRRWTVEKREYWQASFAVDGVVKAAKAVDVPAVLDAGSSPSSFFKADILTSLHLLNGALTKLSSAGPGVRKDAFGFIDIEALDPDRTGVLGIQATTKAAISTRRRKILGLDGKTPKEKKRAAEVRANAIAWLNNGNQIEIWGWDQPGGARTAWVLTVRAVTLNDFKEPEF